MRGIAENNAGIGRIVGNGIEDGALRAAVRIRAVDAGVEDFQRRRHGAGRGNHISAGDLAARQVTVHDEGDFSFNTRLDKPSCRHRAAMIEEHVLEQDAAVGNVDIEGILHGL